jgi:DNA-binding NtrC family response regulator
VLLVDDHPACRQMTARLLATLGYEVEEAESAAQARLALARPGAGFLVMVLDVCLGPAGDDAFARALDRECPHLPVLLISGYSQEVCGALDLLGPRRRFLEKPFTLLALEAALTALLSDAGAADARVSAA